MKRHEQERLREVEPMVHAMFIAGALAGGAGSKSSALADSQLKAWKERYPTPDATDEED